MSPVYIDSLTTYYSAKRSLLFTQIIHLFTEPCMISDWVNGFPTKTRDLGFPNTSPLLTYNPPVCY